MLSIQDFLTNPEFVQWVKNPTEQLDDYWAKWIKANPEHIATVKLAREFLIRMRYEEIKAAGGTKEEILTGLLKTPSSESVSSDQAANPVPPRSGRFSYFHLSQFHRIAAILVIGFGFGWLLGPSKDPIATAPTEVGQIALLTKSTLPGEKLQLTLKDGSKVWMNAATEIRFPEKFDSLERRIVLSGEAYFEVAKDSLRPFIVETNGLSTIALGTSFNITTRKEGRIHISLLTGKVKVSSASEEDVFLDPGKELRYSTSDQQQQVRSFDVDQVMAWKEGKLLFKDATLLSVVRQLEDWYGVHIEIEKGDQIRWKYSAEYKNQSLEDVLNSISYTQQFEYSLKGKQVKFKF